mgnify:FL=1
MEDLLQVGVITTTHGVRGEVKVFPTTDDPARFKKLKNVVLDTGKELVDLEVAGVKFFKNMVIVKFKGIDNINDVEKYRKKSLYVTRENAVKLKKNEYFIADLIGLQAESDEGEDLGELSDVLQTGANDVYVLSKEGTDDILLPAIKECVKEVDLENGKIIEPPTIAEVKKMMLRHARLQLQYRGEYTGIREMRKHVAWYTAGFPHSAKLRKRVNEVESMEALEELLQSWE